MEAKKPKSLICAFACLKDPDIRFGHGEGGEGVLGWNLILQINKFCEPHVLTHALNREAINRKIAENNISGIFFYYIDLPKFFNFTKEIIQVYAYLWQIKAYFVAKKLNKKLHFNVFHHLTYANDWMASYIGALLNVPYLRGPGGGAHYVPKEFVKKYSLRDKLSEVTRSVGQRIFRADPFFKISQSKARAILVCNREALNNLPKNLQGKAVLFSVNGVSSTDLLILGKETLSRNKQFTILAAGKTIKIKAFDLAIEAFKIFNDKFKNTNLVIVGEGPETDNLKNISNKLNLNGKVFFEGWVPRERLFQKINACDVFIFPSLRDGGGNVVVEAMAAGKPVVCFNLAGPGFHVDENCGLKINPTNPGRSVYEMAGALEKLYLNKDLLIKLGRGARERAEKEYNWDKIGENLKKIYLRVLGVQNF